MVRMRSARHGWTRPPARGRSGWRRLWDGLLALAILGLLTLLSARLDGTEPRSLEGRVTVNDGDSLTLGTERIRLRGIDAPELDQTCGKDGGDYPCGRRARDVLVALIGGRLVACTGRERDKYDRLLATCTVGGAELNRSLVKTGWALAYGDYAAEERAARQADAGLWAGTFELPRDWREMYGGMTESEHAAPASFLNWLRRMLRFS